MILQAGRTRIRVDKRTLADHSPVFKAMFSRAEAAGVDLTKELPVVRIDDEPEDMYLVLGALYDPAFYMQTTKSFRIVSAMLRLGKKYGIDELYEDAISRLEHDFPSTLQEYRELHGQTVGGVPVQTHIAPYPALGFEVVNLARAYGLNHILPTAFYICLIVHLRIDDVKKAIWDGVARDDGMVVHLSENDKELCAMALALMIDAQQVNSFHYFYGMPDEIIIQGCASRSRCRAAVASFRRFASYPSPCIIALAGLDGWTEPLCDECAGLAEVLHRLGQEHIWQQLPSFF
ncbi:hypothetical protein FB451DRAFT_1037418 [Mycena latifolia]|nr:hypothetical protein FB451DRAFT_1037418 [Mycena latifolia]